MNPTCLSGVPPDYFSKTGPLWGNPIYRWDVLKKDKYTWWFQRFFHNHKFFDIVRLDHFRGFVTYWEVPAGETTAVKGKWVKVPVRDFFSKLLKKFPKLPIIAEDLGMINDDVRDIIKEFNFPGMKLLLFAFDDTPAKNPYIPHNQIRNCVVYTGTHDNNTVRGWFEKEARPQDRNCVYRYLGREFPTNDAAWELVKMAMMSVADTVILPIQDVLSLGEEARMNRPATVGNNWQWRLTTEMLSPWITAKFRELTEVYGRA
jgi:4-alpha-glucanotransferase